MGRTGQLARGVSLTASSPAALVLSLAIALAAPSAWAQPGRAPVMPAGSASGGAAVAAEPVGLSASGSHAGQPVPGQAGTAAYGAASASAATTPSAAAKGVTAGTAAPSSRGTAAAGTGANVNLLTPGWASLSASQKTILAPLAPEWDQLDSALKGKWLEIATRYPRLSPEHQQRLRERMVAWTRMSPAERQQARIGYQTAADLRSEEQASRLQAKWEAYQALSPEARQVLAERAAERAAERTVDRPAERGAGRSVGNSSLKDEVRTVERVSVAGGSGAGARQASPSAGLPPPLTLSSSGPTVVVARPGTTTVLLTQRRAAPLPGARSAEGMVRPLRSPREGHLDPHTLLPLRRGEVQGRGDSR